MEQFKEKLSFTSHHRSTTENNSCKLRYVASHSIVFYGQSLPSNML